jgi:2TM domain
MQTDDELYQWARTRVQHLKSLYVHIAIYFTVNLMLFAINATGTDARHGNWWVMWPALTWGTVLVLHAIFVLAEGFGRFEGWESRKVDELVQRRKEHAT